MDYRENAAPLERERSILGLNGRVFGLDRASGQPRWSNVLEGSTGEVTVAIDCFAPDGRLLWHQPLEGQGLGRGALGFPGNVARADDPGSR